MPSMDISLPVHSRLVAHLSLPSVTERQQHFEVSGEMRKSEPRDWFAIANVPPGTSVASTSFEDVRCTSNAVYLVWM